MNLMTGLIRPTRGRIRVLGISPRTRKSSSAWSDTARQFDSFPRGDDRLEFIDSYLRVHGFRAKRPRR